MSKPLISIIVRTKNESFWVGKCLHEIKRQIYKNYEVILVDQDIEIGGSLLNEIDSNLSTKKSELISLVVKIMSKTTAFGLYDNGVVGLLEISNDKGSLNSNHDPRHRFWTIRSKHIILATGAFERSLAFGNNDLPGVMTSNASRAYLNRFGILPGKEIIICTGYKTDMIEHFLNSKNNFNISIKKFQIFRNSRDN